MTDTQPADNDCNQSHSPHVMVSPRSNADQHFVNTTGSMIALKDLPLLQRKEFKIRFNASDISYSNISKQIDLRLKEKHTESKDEMTIAELKSFLQSHLGEKSSTGALFQELINAKQHEHETPQQFLYRMMGLKQKLTFTSRETDSDIKFEA